MNDQFEPKIINLCVAQNDKGGLRNSSAITCVSRLDFDHFESQLDSPSFNQRLLKSNPNLLIPRICFNH
jgi:hypothetical protein